MPLLLRLGRLLVAAALACSLSACGSGGGSATRSSDTRSDATTDTHSDASTDLSDDESDLQSDLESDFVRLGVGVHLRRARGRIRLHLVLVGAVVEQPVRHLRRHHRRDDLRTVVHALRSVGCGSHHHRCAVRQRRQHAGLLPVVREPDRGTRHRRHSLGTSAGCLSGTSVGFDLAFVDVTGDTVVAQPDPNAGSVSTAGFNATSGVLAQIYQVHRRLDRAAVLGNDRLRHHRPRRVLRAVHGRRRRQRRLLQRNHVRLVTPRTFGRRSH